MSEIFVMGYRGVVGCHFGVRRLCGGSNVSEWKIRFLEGGMWSISILKLSW